LTGRAAEYMETLTEEKVGQVCVEALGRFLKKTNATLPNLKKVTRYSVPLILYYY